MNNPLLPEAMSTLLRGKKVLICRPENSAKELASALSAMGAECLCFPTLRIAERQLSPAEQQLIYNLDHYQHVIVTSQHAADIALEHIDKIWPQFPIQQKWYAIGEKTASRLQNASIELIQPGKTLTSESLLSYPEFKKIKHEHILILKGIGGRDTLARRLSSKGAVVDELALYERLRPDYSKEEIKQSADLFNPDYIITLSGETLENLISLCAAADINLSSKTFIVPSHRVANIAYSQGFKSVLIPANLRAIDIIKSITSDKKNIK